MLYLFTFLYILFIFIYLYIFIDILIHFYIYIHFAVYTSCFISLLLLNESCRPLLSGEGEGRGGGKAIVTFFDRIHVLTFRWPCRTFGEQEQTFLKYELDLTFGAELTPCTRPLGALLLLLPLSPFHLTIDDLLAVLQHEEDQGDLTYAWRHRRATALLKERGGGDKWPAW